MTFNILHSENQYWSQPRNRLRAVEAAPRNKRKVPGAHIHDLIGLGKGLLLCKKCQGKFNAAINGYEQLAEVTGYDYCWAKCDDCGNFGESNTYLKLRG